MKTLLSLLLLAGCALAANAESGGKEAGKAPAWVNEGSSAENGAFIGMGIGDSRAQAVAHALAEVVKLKNNASKKKDSTMSSTGVLTKHVQEDFGPISVTQDSESGLLKDRPLSKGKSGTASAAEKAFAALEVEEAGEDSQYVEQVTKVEMKGEKGSYRIESEVESVLGSKSYSTEEQKVSIKADNVSLSDLFKELERQWVRTQTYADPAEGTCFVRLQVKAVP